jgi:hypothetical protein
MNHDEWRAEISRLMKLDGMELPALHELWSELLSQAEKGEANISW